MRKRYRVLVLAALVAALVVPVGFALSLESTSRRTVALHTPVASTASAGVTSSMVIAPQVSAAQPTAPYPVPDAAKLLIVGTLLFGLAAAVRKAI
jgi:hypothetical protein